MSIIGRKYKLIGMGLFLLVPSYLIHRAGFLGLMIAAGVGIVAALVYEDRIRG